jgi:hypothetical protein
MDIVEGFVEGPFFFGVVDLEAAAFWDAGFSQLGNLELGQRYEDGEMERRRTH